MAKRLRATDTLQLAVFANWGLGAKLLQSLLEMSTVQIRFVVTNYDTGNTDIWKNEVFHIARERGLTVFHEKLLEFPDLLKLLLQNKVELVICHAYMRILPEDILELPRNGFVNIHPSLLPKYRGPSPTYWVLKNRESVTGLTSHFMDEGIDTGPIINQAEVPVAEQDLLKDIIDKQKRILGELLQETLKRVVEPDFVPVTQREDEATYAPRPKE